MRALSATEKYTLQIYSVLGPENLLASSKKRR
jgi:hypothetical protein